MADYSVTLSANTAGTLVFEVSMPRELDDCFVTMAAWGAGGSNFGGGTLTYAFSPDGGPTLITLKDISGTTYSTTGNDVVNMALGVANHLNTKGNIYVILTGATTPNIIVRAYTNK